jgi:hypothetical protein
MAGRGKHAGTAGDRRRTTAIVVVIALGLVTFGSGYLLARGGNDDTQASDTPTAAASPTHSRSPKPTPLASSTTTPAPTVDPDTLPEGLSFVYAKAVDDAATPVTFTFDLAEFLTDQAAADAAAAHGDESPPPNGYYIVNDNPRLRTMPMSTTVQIRYFPSSGSACCKLQPGTVDGLAAAVNGTAMTDYPDMSYALWRVVVQDGVIVRINQQYLP